MAIKRQFQNREEVHNVHYNFEATCRSEPNDPEYLKQWNLDVIAAAEAWKCTTGGTTVAGDTIVIGLIDQGMDTNHEDLLDVLWKNREEIPNNGLDDDQNGYVDDFRGVSLDYGADIHKPVSDGHGTNVIGMLGAKTNNMTGMASINWNIQVVLFSVDQLTTASAIEAYSYFTSLRNKYNESDGRMGAFIVSTNSSFGWEGLYQEDAPIFCQMYDAMGNAGIISVGAADNSQGNADVFGDLPAHCPSQSLIVVTNTTRQDKLAVAGFGAETIDLGAPGNDVLTTAPGNKYEVQNGTSFSTPLVAGAIALLYSHPSPSFYDNVLSKPATATRYLKNIILESVYKIDDLKDRSTSGGRLDLASIFERLKQQYPVDEVSVYDPSNSFFRIAQNRIFFDPLRKNIELSIYDILGRNIYYQHITSTTRQHLLPTHLMPSGYYILSLKMDGNTFTRKFFAVGS